MSLLPDETDAGTRLAERYNENDNTPTNPLGLGRGAPRGQGGIFVRALRDIAVFGRGVVRTASTALAEIERIAGEAQVAALLVQGGPVSSVQVGNGSPQTGAVKINLDEVSAEVQTQLGSVQAAQTQLGKDQAAIRQGAAAYSLTFGG